jgi:hypothetical protein
MPRKKKPEEPVAPRIASGISFPGRTPPRPANPVGVTAVRRQDAGGARPRTSGAFAAAEACDLFGRPNKGGGASFSRWLQLNHPEIRPEARLSAEEWLPLLTEFADRPIHGHRRGQKGGNHRINKHHRR